MQDNPPQIAARGINQIRRGSKCLVGDAGELRAIGAARAKPLPDLESKRTFEAGMIEDRCR